LTIQIESWPEDSAGGRAWVETTAPSAGSTRYVVRGLEPGAVYQIKVNNRLHQSVRTDDSGQLRFSFSDENSSTRRIALSPQD